MGEAVLPAGPKGKAGLLPDVRGRVARPGVSQSPRRARRTYVRTGEQRLPWNMVCGRWV